MRDEKQTQAKPPLDFTQQVQDLRLHAHVQGAHGFIGHQDLGATGQRAGDGQALPLTAAELAGVTLERFDRQSHLAHQLGSKRLGLGPRLAEIHGAFNQGLPHRAARIE